LETKAEANIAESKEFVVFGADELDGLPAEAVQ
jgi:hypothetical protein